MTFYKAINQLEALLDTHEYTREVVDTTVKYTFTRHGKKVTFALSNEVKRVFVKIDGRRAIVSDAFKMFQEKETYRVIAVVKETRHHGFFGTENLGVLLQSMNEDEGQIEKFWVNQTNLDVKVSRWDVVTANFSTVGNFATLEIV